MAAKSMKPIFCEAIEILATRPCFLAEHSLRHSNDMLTVAARFMDVFNDCLASRMAANAVIHELSKSGLESVLEADFSLDSFSRAEGARAPHFFQQGNTETFLEEQKIVWELMEFGRE